MKRILSLLIAFILLLSVATVCAAAKATPAATGEDDDEYVYVTIYLDPYGESTASGAYYPGDIPIEPESPGREGQFFVGWYADPEFKELYDFSKPLYADVDIYARFVPDEDTYDVFLYLDADAQMYTSGMTVVKGMPCPKPGDPGREDYDFGGWYADRALTIPVDFTAPRYEDLSLFPKWIFTHNHSKEHMTLIPASDPSAAVDGMAAHYECDKCGKLYSADTAIPVEITDINTLVTDATGPYVLGDADGDGTVNIMDATAIQRRLAEMKTASFCRGAADADGDGDLTIFDATAIQRCLAELPTNENIGKTVS